MDNATTFTLFCDEDKEVRRVALEVADKRGVMYKGNSSVTVDSKMQNGGYIYIKIDGDDNVQVGTSNTKAARTISLEGLIFAVLKSESAPKPICVGGYKLNFQENGSIKLGCATIGPEQVKEIYERSAAKRDSYVPF